MSEFCLIVIQREISKSVEIQFVVVSYQVHDYWKPLASAAQIFLSQFLFQFPQINENVPAVFMFITFHGTRGTYKVKVPHAPLQDVTLIFSLEWQPWLSRYT